MGLERYVVDAVLIEKRSPTEPARRGAMDAVQGTLVPCRTQGCRTRAIPTGISGRFLYCRRTAVVRFLWVTKE